MSNFNQYSWFKTKRTELATLLQESSTVIKDLSMPQFSGNLKKLSQKVHSDTFKIQLVGTFKNGKSTFINALLGEDILPTRSLPCTAVVSEVKYGDTKKAILKICDHANLAQQQYLQLFGNYHHHYLLSHHCHRLYHYQQLLPFHPKLQIIS